MTRKMAIMGTVAQPQPGQNSGPLLKPWLWLCHCSHDCHFPSHRHLRYLAAVKRWEELQSWRFLPTLSPDNQTIDLPQESVALLDEIPMRPPRRSQHQNVGMYPPQEGFGCSHLTHLVFSTRSMHPLTICLPRQQWT